MNLLIFTLAKNFTRRTFFFGVLTSLLISEVLMAWSIDLSRRRKDITRKEASIVTTPADLSPMEMIGRVVPIEPKQEIVILNTEKGFVPDRLRLRQGERYQVHVVNVNKKNQNVSFIMDYFGQHHGTFYGDVKSFVLKTDKEGVYSFQSPELGFEGELVVFGSGKPSPVMNIPGPSKVSPKTLRGIASEAK